MAEIALIWYSMDDSSIIATRAQASAWAEELDLPRRILASPVTPGSFTKSCQETVVRYPGPDGQERCAKAVEIARRPELVTFEVRRDSVRLAQVKLFAARRTEVGQVKGSAQVRTSVGANLDDHDGAGAGLWIETFLADYERTHQIVPSKLVRQIALLTLLETSTPIYKRKWLYFCYVDQLAPTSRLRTFLHRVCDDADVTILPIEKGADLTTFTASADADLAERITEFNDRLHRLIAMGRKPRHGTAHFEGIAGLYRGLVARVAEHETRLSATLPTSHSKLELTRRLTKKLGLSDHLLRVSGQ